MKQAALMAPSTVRRLAAKQVRGSGSLREEFALESAGHETLGSGSSTWRCAAEASWHTPSQTPALS